MSDLCEIVESVGVATSSCPATEVVVVARSAASARSSVALGVTLTLASAGAAVSTADPSSYALLQSVGEGSSAVEVSATLTETLTSTGAATSETRVAIPLTLTATGAATSAAYPELPPPVLVSTGVATSAVSASTAIGMTVTSTAAATSGVTVYLDETLTATGVGSSVLTAQRVVDIVLTSTGAGVSSVPIASMVPTLEVLTSTGVATSSITARTDWNVTAESSAEAVSSVYFKDPGRIAWIVNTESAAMAWYDNFDFNSVAQVDGTTFAAGPNGVFELTGDDDDGDTIDARVRSGFLDFNSPFQKRVDTLYLGYASPGVLATQLSVLDSGTAPYQFQLEARTATAPRNSRIVPGKGMFGRYWRVEFRNIGGADFSVYDIDVDLAISNRKL